MQRLAIRDGTSFGESKQMNFVEHTLCFHCDESWLYGILSLPEQASARGVLMVVGGPQYRAGSHRQFVLLARSLASQGVAVMRFDYRGMGDSEGEPRNFESIEDDLKAAAKHFFASAPAVTELVIFGVCDAASAALFYAHQNERVSGLVLINPWIRTEEGIANAYFRHYYTARILQADLWRKILGGTFDYAATYRSLEKFLADAVFHGKASKTDMAAEALNAENRDTENRDAENRDTENRGAASLPGRMLDGLQRFQGQMLVILSENDLTALEFSDYVKKSKVWKKLLESSNVTRFELLGADHTFSRRDWRAQVSAQTIKWLESW